MARIVDGPNGFPIMLADDVPMVLHASNADDARRVIEQPEHVACTTGEALRILQAVDPKLTADDVSDLLARNSVARHAAWDLQSVLALADSMAELRRTGKARRDVST